MFSDHQLVTGIALLISGYVQLPCDIDAYHWQILAYLVWFSSLTHLTTLTVLRQYFRETPAIRSWRAALMLVTMIMLSVALLPTGDDYWIVFWDPAVPGSMLAGLPVRCFYQRFASNHAFSHDGPYLEFTNERVMVISILILILGYMTRIIKLSSRATDITIYWLRLAPGIQWKE